MSLSDPMFNALLRIECDRVTCEYGEWRVDRYTGSRNFGSWEFIERLRTTTVEALAKRGLITIEGDVATVTPKGAEVIA
jgi:hypothetical protein